MVAFVDLPCQLAERVELLYSMHHTLLIYNPVAGRYPSRILTERAARVFQPYGWGVEIETTLDGSHIPILARQAVQENLDSIIIVGGDGSINKALPGLIGTETALGVLPAGTSNVWAQELGLPGLSLTRWSALEESAHRLARGSIQSVDVGLCNDKYFLLWAGIGLDAFIVHRIEPRKQWQKNFTIVRYAAGVVWSAIRWSGINLRVITNDHIILQQVWSLWSGQHVNSNRVQCLPFQKIRMESDSPIFIQMDGEPEIGGEQVTIEVLPRLLKVLIPDQASKSLLQNATN